MHKFWIIAVFIFLVMTMSAYSQDGSNSYGYTYHQADGNRIVDGRGSFPDVDQVEFAFNSPQIWLAGVVYDGAPHWVSVDAQGTATLLMPGGMMVSMASLPPGMPPMVHSSPDGIALIQPPEDASLLSHPVPTFAGLLYIAENGDVVLADSDSASESRLSVNAMLDARPVISPDGLIAVYSAPTTDRYIHGIMGDEAEAASISILDASVGGLQLVNKIDLSGSAVFEGLSPIWADVDGDATFELIATISDVGLGAGVAVLAQDGQTIANGPAIGQGNRWRHQLAWTRIGENGEVGLLEVLTPHIGGVVGFFAFSRDELVRTASGQGYTSHVIGSRNLDMAVIGDFNGDGQMEVVLPTQDRTRVVGLQLRDDTFNEVWSLPLAGRLSTNLAAVGLPDGSLALAAGTEMGTVYLWLGISE